MNKLFQIFWNDVENLSHHGEMNEKVRHSYNLCKIFYGFILFLFIRNLYQSNIGSYVNKVNNFDPKWPVLLLYKFSKTEPLILFKFILFISVIFCAIGLIYGTKYRIARIFAFLSIITTAALENSFKSGSHSMHLSIWISFFLVFIPSQNGLKYDDKKDLFRVFFIIRSFILMIYFSSGLIKLFRTLQFYLQGKLIAFNKNGFPNQIAKDWYYSSEPTLFGPFIVLHESWIWPLMYFIGFLIEFLAISILFKPKFDRYWAVLFSILHIGILITLGPNFENHLFVVVLFMGYNIFGEKQKVDNKLVV